MLRKYFIVIVFIGNILYGFSQEQKRIDIPEWNRIIIQNIKQLNEGDESFLEFINSTNKKTIASTDYFPSSKILIFSDQKRIILSDTYYPSDKSCTFIFNENGELIKEFINPGITYQVEKIKDSDLFYLIVYNKFIDFENIFNTLIIYDLTGNKILEHVYSQDELEYNFKYKNKLYLIDLLKPELP